MKKLMIYPYDKGTSSIARNRDLLSEYELVSIVAPKGLKADGKDASYFDGGPEVGITISDSFEEELKKCDVVLFIKGISVELAVYEEKVKLAYKEKKEIIMQENLGKRLTLTEELGDYINYLEENSVDCHEEIKKNYWKGILESNVPSILVFGSGEYCNKFDIQLGLRRQFLKKGYKVSQLGTKEFSKIFGFSPLPNYLYDPNIDFENKIIALNHYIHEVEIKEKPDIFIIGVPSGIMRINNETNNRFGELAYLIGNAIQADIGILSMYFAEDIHVAEIDELSRSCKYTLHCNTSYINMANSQFVIEQGLMEKDRYLTLDSNRVDDVVKSNKDKFENYNLNLLNIFNKEDEVQIVNNITDELSENVVVI